MMSAQPATKPVPCPSPESIPYWEGAKDKKLLLQHCRSCNQFWFPPSSRCHHCLSPDFVWQQVSGQGRIYSFVVYHRLYHQAFENDLPYVVAIVELREGSRLLTNIAGASWQDVRCDMPVRVCFDDDGRGAVIPKFTTQHG